MTSQARGACLLGGAFVVGLGMFGCKRGSPEPAEATAPSSHAPTHLQERAATTAWAEDEVTRALTASRAFSAALAADPRAARPSYLALRRALAALEPIARAYSKMGVVVLAGPTRSTLEVGGALLLADDALDREAWPEASTQARQVTRSLMVVEQEFLRATIERRTVAVTLSNAAYELGLRLVEANPAAASQEDAVLADSQGLLDGLVRGSQALERELGAAKPARTRLERALAPFHDALDAAHDTMPSGRASLTLATGELGVSLRALANQGGIEVPLPYLARKPTHDNGWDEPITALTLPAAERAGKRVDAHLAELGRRLFSDRRLSKRQDRSCASCHVPEAWFTDGRRLARSLDPKVRLRNTPSLLYAPVGAAQLWDGRRSSISAQALGVIYSHAEMGLSSEMLSKRVSDVPEYAPLASAEGVVEPERVAAALAAFQEEVMVPDTAPIDDFARGDTGALSAEERRGFDLFAGKGRCTRCHLPPLFGGSRPLDFATPVFSVLGVPEERGGHTLDPDRGRISASRLASDEHGFKTPTVRNIAKTGPYFHNGAYDTVRDVLVFYNDGGGRGLDIDVPNQDPDVRPLHLSDDELDALELFVTRSLEDRIAPVSLVKPR